MKNFIVIKLTVLLILNVCSICFSQQIANESAIHAIMGEARGEGYTSMLWHASAIRNRKTLSGVYGKRVPISILKRERKQVWNNATKAWEESGRKRITDADCWGSLICDKKWINKMRRAGYKYRGQVNNTVFYKSV